VAVSSGRAEVEVAAGESARLSPTGGPRLIAPAAELGSSGQAPAQGGTPGQGGDAVGELASLRVRLAEQERELARLRQESSAAGDRERERDMRRFIDPTREELLERAQRCQINFNYPNFDGAPPRLSERLARRHGLSDTEREAYDELMKEIHAEVPAELRKLYAEMSGDATTAARLSPSSLLGEILQKSPDDLILQARTRLARERAGLAAPPSNLAAAAPVERALRLIVGLGSDFERRLGERVGAARAQSLRTLRESWRNTSSMSGCQGQ
jgi:hypothetical protein